MVNLKFKTTALAVSLLCLNACGGLGNTGVKWNMRGYVESTIPSSDSVQSQWQKAALDDKRESVRGGNAGVLLNLENLDPSNSNLSQTATISTKQLEKNGDKWELNDYATGNYSRDPKDMENSVVHGTAMAAVTTKIAPDALIQVAPRAINGVLSGLESALQAIKGGAKVDIINQSFGVDITEKSANDEYKKNNTTITQKKIATMLKLNQQGALIIQATGNEGKAYANSESAYPLLSDDLKSGGFIAVTGTHDGNSVYSGYNKCGDLVKDWCLTAYSIQSPLSFNEKGQQISLGGTSSATAFTSGVAARVKTRYDWYSAADLKNTLLTTAIDKGDKGVDAVWGHGLINPDAALNGYGRFDNANTVLNVQGNKKAYYFDNDISGTGGIVKRGSDTLVMNGDNSYTGTTTVEQGALVVNGNTKSHHIVKNDAYLAFGDKRDVFNTSAITLEKGATLETQTAGLNISGSLNANGATINTSIGSPISASGSADLRNAEVNVLGVKKGVVTKAGTDYVIVSAEQGIQTNNATKLQKGSKVSDLVKGDITQIDKQTIVAKIQRSSVGDAAYSMTNFTGKDQVINLADKVMDKVDLAAINNTSTSTIASNSSNAPLPSSAAVSVSGSQAIYEKLLQSQSLNRDLFDLDLSHTARAQAHTANAQVQRGSRLLAQNVDDNGNAWLNLGWGASDKTGLKGIAASSHDNSQFIGAGKRFGKHSFAAQVGRNDYAWRENFADVGKRIETKGTGVDFAYAYRVNPQWQAKALLSWDNLKSENQDRFNLLNVGMGVDYRFGKDNLLFNPYATIWHTHSSKANFTATNGMDLTAKDVRHTSTQAEVGTKAMYAFGQKQQFGLTANVWLRQMLSGSSRYVFDAGDFSDEVVLKNNRKQPEIGTSVGGQWRVNDKLSLSAQGEYRKGKYDTHKGVNVGANLRF